MRDTRQWSIRHCFMRHEGCAAVCCVYSTGPTTRKGSKLLHGVHLSHKIPQHGSFLNTCFTSSTYQHLDNSTARLQNPWSQCEMVLLAARLVHSMSRDSELFHLTTFVSSADHASSDGNSIRTWRQHGSGRPSKLLTGVLPNMSTPWSSSVC